MADTPVAHVIYNEKRLIPAPLITFSKSYRRLNTGEIVGADLTATLSGNLVACKGFDGDDSMPTDLYGGSGYPPDDDTCCKFENLLNMQELIRDHFEVGEDYHWFEVQAIPAASKKWRARVTSVEFPEGRWTETTEYTITLELQSNDDELGTIGGVDDWPVDNILSFDENWDVQYEEENGHAYQLTHTITCQAKDYYDEDLSEVVPGWEKAYEWLKSHPDGLDARLELDVYTDDDPEEIKNERIFNVPGFDLQDYEAWDYKRSQTNDETSGTFTITETWTLAKKAVFRQVNISVNKNASGDDTVQLEGSFVAGLHTETPNPDAARTTYQAWHDASEPYNLANEYYQYASGCKTLNDCPISVSVQYADEVRSDEGATSGDDTTSAKTRAVSFTYEFNTNPDQLFDKNITTVVTKNHVEDCHDTVSVSGVIIGKQCVCATTAWVNAQEEYNRMVGADEIKAAATTAYGSSAFGLLVDSETRNEREARIEFNHEYSSKFDENYHLHYVTTESWDCNTRDSTGDALETTVIEGSVIGVCDVTSGPTFATIEGLVPTPASFGITGYQTGQTLVKDEDNLKINFTYTFSGDAGLARVERTVTSRVGPDKCAVTFSTVELSINGNGCTDTDKYNNANAAFSAETPDSLVTGGSRLSEQIVRSLTQGTINATYEYSNEGDVAVSVTITETYDGQDCDNVRTSVSGELKGRCGAPTSAYAAALALYNASHQPTDYSTDCLQSKSTTRNEPNGMLNFQYEFIACPSGQYTHEQTVTLATSLDQSCDTVTIEGTIDPYCMAAGGPTAALGVAQTAWATISGTLSAVALAASGAPTVRETRTSYSESNKGRITYNYEFNTCTTCITDALEESINISWTHPADVFAIVPILGRASGPLIQDKGSKTVKKCAVAVEAKFEQNTGCILSKPSSVEADVQSIISSAGCCTGDTSHLESDNESWNPKTGRYSRQVVYVCEVC